MLLLQQRLLWSVVRTESQVHSHMLTRALPPLSPRSQSTLNVTALDCLQIYLCHLYKKYIGVLEKF